jgi:DNA-binding LacI/PurR family transcriptional regulator
LLGFSDPPDGIFCYNDIVAFGAIEAILKTGRRIPHDVAVIGCGDLDNPRMSKVPLSTIDHDPAMMGKETARLAISLIGAKVAPPPQVISVPHGLIARASSLRLNDDATPHSEASGQPASQR